MFDLSRHRFSPPASRGFARSFDNALLDAHRYHEVFDTLRLRVADRPRLLNGTRDPDAIGLGWLLAHEGKVVSRILEALVAPDFALGLQRKVRVFAGKPRDIFVAEWPDRIVLMAMAKILSERIEAVLTDHVFSFRKGRSHWDALRAFRTYLRAQPAGRPIHVLRRDVRKYGDSIDPARVTEDVRTRLGMPAEGLFARVLGQALRAEHLVDGERRRLERGIPSGSPLVPPLENLHLDPLDRALGAVPGAFYARYGDDFLFASPSADDAKRATDTIAGALDARGLVVSPDKALDLVLTAPGQGVEWLGFRVSRDAHLGCKRERWRAARRRICGRIDRLVQVAFRADLDERQRLDVLRAGLEEALQPGADPILGSLFFEQDDPESLRMLDRHLVRHVAGALGKRAGGGRQVGWRLFRKLGYRSLAHARAEARWG